MEEALRLHTTNTTRTFSFFFVGLPPFCFLVIYIFLYLRAREMLEVGGFGKPREFSGVFIRRYEPDITQSLRRSITRIARVVFFFFPLFLLCHFPPVPLSIYLEVSAGVLLLICFVLLVS